MSSPLTEAQPAPQPTRSLAPREHGAYGQLGVPLVCGLLLGRTNLAGVLLTIASVTAFLAHEPLLVILGQRGTKAKTVDGPRASRRLLLLGGVTAASGLAALALATNEARLALLLPALLATAVVWFVFRKQEKTAWGEIIAAAALSGAALPVMMACGVPKERAALVWGIWTLGFTVATLAVRAVIARAKNLGKGPLFLSLAVSLLIALGSVCAWLFGLTTSAVPLSLAPFIVLGIGVCVVPVHTKHLKKVGWSLVGASVLALVLIAVMLR